MSHATALPRRILMTSSGEDELWDLTLELCGGLSAAGVEVVLAVTGPRPDQRQLTEAMCLDGVEVVLGPHRRAGELQAMPAVDGGDWLLELEATRACELVHLHGYEHGLLPFRSPKVMVGFTCGLTWWRAVKGGALPPVAETYRRKVAASLAAADCVVAPSAWLLDALDEHYGPLPTSLVIPAGRSPGAFAPGEKEPFVLAVGSLADDARNTSMLARIASRVPWPVKIAGSAGDGEGPPCDPTRAALLGRLSPARLARVYGEAAIFASASRFETFGLSIHEAALSECALVLPELPALRELWGGAAVFVPPDDEEALRTSLCTLMNQPELTALLALRARQRATLHSATRMTRRHLAVYRRLIAQRPAQPWARELRSSCVS
jgi:glycogen(starch) synthase